MARSEVSSLFSRLRSDLPRGNGALSRKKLSSLTTKNLGGSSLLFLLEHEVGDFCFFFKVEQASLFEGLHPFFERMLSSSFEEVAGIVKISFPYLERKRSLLAD